MDEVKVGAHQRGMDFKRFAKQNMEIVTKLFLIPLYLLAMLVMCLVVKHTTTVRLERDFAQRLTAARIQTEQETADRIRTELGFYEAQSEAGIMDREAESIAKVLYGMQYNSEVGLKSAVWCVLNRVDNKLYPDTVQGVCEQADQWVGYYDTNPVLVRLKELALEQLKVWHSGVRPMGSNYVYLEWSSKEITLRDNYGSSGVVHKWFEADWGEE
ncbi:MAG: cell wall hydrolase [Oscillospiraceae bacterium]|nr:cell wall hydrolase [Oscillospiraceae bacterium]